MKNLEVPEVILDGRVVARGAEAEQLLEGTRAGRCTDLLDAVDGLLPPFVDAAAARPIEAPALALAVLELTGELGLHLARRELPWVGKMTTCSYGTAQRAGLVLVERARVATLLDTLGETHLAADIRAAGAGELPVVIVAGHGVGQTGIATTTLPLPAPGESP